MNNLDQILETEGLKAGTWQRLERIAQLDSGNRGEAARQVLDRRSQRLDWMAKGLSFEQACLIVNSNTNE